MPILSQSDQRRDMTFKDQWGRRFFARVENKTGDPCWPLTPVNWSAPKGVNWPLGLGARNDYYVLHTDPDNPAFLWFDGERFVADVQAAWDRYEERIYEVGVAINKEAFDRENPTREVLAKVGKPPMPLVLAEAMAAGDRWCLGLKDEQPIAMPDWAQPLFREDVKTRRTFNSAPPTAETRADPASAGATRRNGRFVKAGA